MGKAKVISQVACLKDVAPDEPASWSRPKELERPVRILCQGANSFQSVVRATYNSPDKPSLPSPAPSYDREPAGAKKGIGITDRARSESAFVARLKNKPGGVALWNPLFVNGKLAGAEDTSDALKEKSKTIDWTQVDAKPLAGSTAIFDPYVHTVHGSKVCPYMQRIHNSTAFIVPKGPPPDSQLGLQGDRLSTPRNTYPQVRPVTVGGIKQGLSLGLSPQKSPCEITTFDLRSKATAKHYAYKDHYRRTRSVESPPPAYLKALSTESAFHRCPSDLHNFYEYRRMKPIVQDLRMFGPPIDMMAYKQVHWGPINFN